MSGELVSQTICPVLCYATRLSIQPILLVSVESTVALWY